MSIEKEVPVTAVDTHYDKVTGQLLLLQGDENGEIVVYDISPIINSELIPEMNPVDVVTGNLKRNPHREFVIEKEERKKKSKGGANDSDSDMDESQIPKDNPILQLEG